MHKIELVAEIGINANGDLSVAKRLIDVACMTGFDYVKFQKRDLDLVFTPEELAKPKESPWGTTYREYKEHLEFSLDDYRVIDGYCRSKGIRWFVSSWDRKSLENMANKFPLAFIKVPSALMTDLEFIADCAWHGSLFGVKLILSTGGCTPEMIDRAVNVIRGRGAEIYCIMQCTATYPSEPEEQNLRCISFLKERYPWTKIGFSNHSPGLTYLTGAMALGAEVIECHVTLSRSMYGSDQAASLEPEGMFRVGKYARNMEKALGNGRKEVLDREEQVLKKLRRISTAT